MKKPIKLTLVTGEVVTAELDANFPYSLTWGIPDWVLTTSGEYVAKSAIVKVSE